MEETAVVAAAKLFDSRVSIGVVVVIVGCNSSKGPFYGLLRILAVLLSFRRWHTNTMAQDCWSAHWRRTPGKKEILCLHVRERLGTE